MRGSSCTQDSSFLLQWKHLAARLDALRGFKFEFAFVSIFCITPYNETEKYNCARLADVSQVTISQTSPDFSSIVSAWFRLWRVPLVFALKWLRPQVHSLQLGYLAAERTKLLLVRGWGVGWSQPRSKSSFVLSPDFSHEIIQVADGRNDFNGYRDGLRLWNSSIWRCEPVRRRGCVLKERFKKDSPSCTHGFHTRYRPFVKSSRSALYNQFKNMDYFTA